MSPRMLRAQVQRLSFFGKVHQTRKTNRASPNAISINNQIMSRDSTKLRPLAMRRLALMCCVVTLTGLQGCGSVPESPARPGAIPQLRAVAFAELPGWPGEDIAQTWHAFQASCAAPKRAAQWDAVCAQAARQDATTARDFFERWFTPHALRDDKGKDTGLLTGYYEPLLRGSRTRTESAQHPVYGLPPDLLQIDLAATHPDLAHQRLRGRLQGRKVIAYHDRAAIESAAAPLSGQELLWVEDAVALFFLHIQGSGKVTFADGTRVRLAYADQNGHPYRALGKILMERGQLKREEISLQSIRAWLLAHPQQAREVMAQNPSYIFFQEQPDSPLGPVGTPGVALTPGYSVAVDARVTQMGTPMYVASTWPGSEAPIRRLTVAQDTGGAIRGAVRADLFLGEGEQAEDQAGRMRQPLRAWVLLPRSSPISDRPPGVPASR